jgi:hypothetical protein
MADKIRIPIGTDHTLKFALAVNSAPLDLTEVEEIEVKVYQKKSNILANFLLSDNEVEITSAANGLCECFLAKESITNVPTGKLFIQISVDVPNENIDSGFERLILTETEIGELVAIA